MNTTAQPFNRHEPISIGDALGAPVSLADYLAAHDAEYRADTEGVCELGKCRHCGTALAGRVIPMGLLGFLPNVCCDACADRGKAEIEGRERRAADARLAPVIPAEFLHWDGRRGNSALLAEVNGQFSFSSRMGLVLHGPSGRCKTRVLWQLVRRIAEQPDGLSWFVLDAFEAATTGIPKDAERADFLMLDDLGNEPTNGKWESALLHLCRRRCDWHRPIFITTQLTGAQFQARYFNGPAAAAILRRLRERCHFIAA